MKASGACSPPIASDCAHDAVWSMQVPAITQAVGQAPSDHLGQEIAVGEVLQAAEVCKPFPAPDMNAPYQMTVRFVFSMIAGSTGLVVGTYYIGSAIFVLLHHAAAFLHLTRESPPGGDSCSL